MRPNPGATAARLISWRRQKLLRRSAPFFVLWHGCEVGMSEEKTARLFTGPKRIQVKSRKKQTDQNGSRANWEWADLTLFLFQKVALQTLAMVMGFCSVTLHITPCQYGLHPHSVKVTGGATFMWNSKTSWTDFCFTLQVSLFPPSMVWQSSSAFTGRNCTKRGATCLVWLTLETVYWNGLAGAFNEFASGLSVFVDLRPA